MVQAVRKVHPKMGVRKIYWLLKDEFQKQGINIGRDKLFILLSDNQLLIRRRRSRARTTNSYHSFYKYDNLIKDIEPYKANQVWVSDITYIKTCDQFCYLFLVTDMYSRRIMGYRVARNLEARYAVEALQRAINKAGSVEGLIHHSDRGIQYCSKEYVTLCQDYNIKLSMTQDGNPTDNPIAERVNGILKQEYLMDQSSQSYQKLKNQMKSIVYKYNQLRPHLSCNMLTPNSAYSETGILKKKWKNYYIDQ